MADFDNDMLLDAEYDAQEVEFIKNYLPSEVKDKFSEEQIYYILDVICEYYSEKGVFDEDADDDSEIEIDLDDVAEYVAQKAKKEDMGDFDPEDLLFIIQGDFEFNVPDDEE
ncbi:MAG: hypothetical protein IKP43_08110 [Bacteroidaceae bacterium]|jgi:hypothetical protein|nr:hypothetical protein [Bacteroidaceae bacterium]